jgi:hypothetical protein
LPGLGQWLGLSSLGLALLVAGGGCKPSTTLTEAVQLHLKDPETGRPLERGPSATLRFGPSGVQFRFVLQARQLERAESYTLLYLPDPWPGQGLIRLAQGTSDGGGNLQLDGSVDTGSLPAETDANRAAGASLWLVPTAMVGEEGLEDAETRRCLQPAARIRFTDTDGRTGASPANGVGSPRGG